MAFENAKSKFVEVVTFADIDAEKRVDDSLMQILKLKFGNKVTFFQTLSTRFGQNFEVADQARF